MALTMPVRQLQLLLVCLSVQCFIGDSVRALRAGGSPSLDASNLRTSNVSMMVTVTEHDLDSIAMRIPRLSLQQHFDFGGHRYFIVDTRGEPPSERLINAMDAQVRAGHMDSWIAVDYSDDYVARLMQDRPVTWAGGHKGNLVYYFMLDWSPTRYVVHYDLDIVLWARSGYSWIAAGLEVLQRNTSVLEVQPPLPSFKATSGAGTPEKQWTSAFSCGGATFVTSRYYLMDRERYQRLWGANVSTKAPVEELPPGCKGHWRHWEVDTSCATCAAGYLRADLMDSSAAWVLHFPGVPSSSLQKALELASRGVAVPDEDSPFNAAPLELWLARADAPSTRSSGQAVQFSKAGSSGSHARRY